MILCVLYVGCVSLTIQGKRDLKALSSEKIMINKCIDHSYNPVAPKENIIWLGNY